MRPQMAMCAASSHARKKKKNMFDSACLVAQPFSKGIVLRDSHVYVPFSMLSTVQDAQHKWRRKQIDEWRSLSREPGESPTTRDR